MTPLLLGCHPHLWPWLVHVVLLLLLLLVLVLLLLLQTACILLRRNYSKFL